jgi:hypothetical protein
MDDWVEAEAKRQVLRNVAAYRALCHQVRRKSTWGLAFGALMLGFWFMLPPKGPIGQYSLFGLIYLGLACLEFAAALWNRFFPSAEGVLVDGLVLFGFGGANLVRAMIVFQAKGQPDWFYLVFGGYWVLSGFGAIRSYIQLRRAFAVRPTGDHLRWFDDLLRDVRQADPESDSTALDLPTRPPVRGKLLGDTAVFLTPGADDPIITAREEVEIVRRPTDDPDHPTGFLSIDGADYGKFPLDPENWRNYAHWKADGGEPPPPLPARRVGDGR